MFTRWRDEHVFLNIYAFSGLGVTVRKTTSVEFGITKERLEGSIDIDGLLHEKRSERVEEAIEMTLWRVNSNQS